MLRRGTGTLTFDGGPRAYLETGKAPESTIHVPALPEKSCEDGKVVLVFEPVGATRFAGVCAMELWRK